MWHINRALAVGALSVPLALGVSGVALADTDGVDNVETPDLQGECAEADFEDGGGHSVLGLGVLDFIFAGGEDDEGEPDGECAGFADDDTDREDQDTADGLDEEEEFPY